MKGLIRSWKFSSRDTRRRKKENYSEKGRSEINS